MRQCEYKRRYNPEMGRYVKTHIYNEDIKTQYGEGIADVFKSIGKKLFGQTMKKTLKTGLQKGAEKAIENAATKTGDFAAKKAGDKIIQLLSKKGNKMGAPLMTQQTPTVEQPLTDYEINERVNQLLSGGKLRKLKFI